MFVDVGEQAIPVVLAIALAPQVDLPELHRAKAPFRQTVTAVGPRLGIEERTADRRDPAGLALDEPGRPVVMRRRLVSNCDDVADSEFPVVYSHFASISRVAAVISSADRMPFSTKMRSIDADQRS